MEIISIPYEENEDLAIEELDTATKKAAPNLPVQVARFSYACEDDGKVLGRITAELFCDTVEIKFLVVSEEARGLGIGKKLVTAVENAAREKGCRHITLESMSFNNWQFYLAIGYEVLAKIPDSPMPGETHYFLHKTL